MVTFLQNISPWLRPNGTSHVQIDAAVLVKNGISKSSSQRVRTSGLEQSTRIYTIVRLF